MAHDSRPLARIEQNVGLLGIVIVVLVSLGGLAEITPLFVNAHTVAPAPGLRPYDALRLAGRDVYVREACYQCHSQMIRTLRFETQRYGRASDASESVYDRPFQWGSKRTGPDLARIGGKYSDAWHRLHLIAPRELVPQSNMPNYPWLAERELDHNDIAARMRVLRRLGDPYTDEDIAAAYEAVRNKTELDALVAYLQGLGVPAQESP
jgi:cytochrome c oxidase cbb3-type subunit 2